MLRTPAPLTGDVRRQKKRMLVTLTIPTFISARRASESNARVLYASGEPGGGRKFEALALARLASSFVRHRARFGPGLFFKASPQFARVLLPLGEAGSVTALGQSSVSRLARHFVRHHAKQQTICFAGVRRQAGQRALKTDGLRRLTSQSKGRLRAAHAGAPHWRC